MYTIQYYITFVSTSWCFRSNFYCNFSVICAEND